MQKWVKTKKEAKKKTDLSGKEQDKENYKQTKKKTRGAVAKAKAEKLNEVYKAIETPAGEEKILQNARARDAASKDLAQIGQIKDSNGIVLAEENEIKSRWDTYFEGLLNEENPRTVFEDGLPKEVVTLGVTRREVDQAVKMKSSKAAGIEESWRGRHKYLVGPVAKDLQSGNDSRGMEKPSHPHL
ncbi:uncharacterized protein [Palaemon carinicauda]|uniref:uncharacterized protein n=1 Tax=Palaemon carinicauda TaxID=392227 RepID=UPI0035B594E8